MFVQSLLSPTPAAKRDGFTLIELLVSIAVFGLLTVTLAQFLSSFLVLKFNAETRLRMRQEGNYALDRIEFLVRNSVTKPACGLSPSVTNYNKCKTSACTGNNAQLHFNYQISSTEAPKRSLVWWEGGSGSLGKLFFGECNSSTKHSSCTPYSGLANKVNLTNTSGESSQPFEAVNFSIYCAEPDSFTGGFTVTVKFDLKYKRKVLSGDNKELVEHFERQVAVRNNAQFTD